MEPGEESRRRLGPDGTTSGKSKPPATLRKPKKTFASPIGDSKVFLGSLAMLPPNRYLVLMAKKVSVTLEDDINGDVITEGLGGGTYGIICDGDVYEIDLGAKNVSKLINPLVEHARKLKPSERDKLLRGTRHRSTTTTSPRSVTNFQERSREANNDIRRWAEANGIKVSTRGRISAEVVEKYEAAHAR